MKITEREPYGTVEKLLEQSHACDREDAPLWIAKAQVYAILALVRSVEQLDATLGEIIPTKLDD